MSILWLLSHPKKTIENDCQECTRRICCVVYDILSTSNQGRTKDLIKSSGEECHHLCKNGDCGVYEKRETMAGYKENCKQYTCHNVGPLLDAWIIKNSIDIFKSSYKIGLILKKLGFFIDTNRYNERYRFIKENLLVRYTNEDCMLAFISEWQKLQIEFNTWANENPEDPEFDAQLKRLFSND